MIKSIQNQYVWLTATVAIGCGATQGCELRPLPGQWTRASSAAGPQMAQSDNDPIERMPTSPTRPVKSLQRGVDARPVSVGELLITEIMSRPLLLADSVGEYLEVAYLGPRRQRFPPMSLRLPDGRNVSLSRRSHMVKEGRVWLVRSVRKQPLRLPNHAGRIELWAGSTMVDVAQYTRQWPWPRRKPGVALCRFRSDMFGDRGRAWRRCRRRLRHVERGSPGHVAHLARWVARYEKSRSSHPGAGIRPLPPARK